MSGHSKWHNIQAKKNKADSARGKIFTKLGRELLMAVKQGGPDPAGNSKLKDVIAKCKANNMPNDTINSAIKRAAGAGNNESYEEVTYEGYGPNGVAIIVNASTDNRNRTAADVRHIFDKFGGNLGTTGCVSYMFEKKGVIVIEKESTNLSEDDLIPVDESTVKKPAIVKPEPVKPIVEDIEEQPIKEAKGLFRRDTRETLKALLNRIIKLESLVSVQADEIQQLKKGIKSINQALPDETRKKVFGNYFNAATGGALNPNKVYPKITFTEFKKLYNAL